jgi:hypothetical protein
MQSSPREDVVVEETSLVGEAQEVEIMGLLGEELRAEKKQKKGELGGSEMKALAGVMTTDQMVKREIYHIFNIDLPFIGFYTNTIGESRSVLILVI